MFAEKIISFIAQFEDVLVRIWNKPKFVLNSNYVITLDKLTDEIINKLLKHSNLEEQIKEWQELRMVDNNFSFSERSEAHKYLPIDTKHFKNLELDILALFDNLDEALDGRLIHSENYQALNTLQEKYKEKIQCIYIDPPFNLDKNANFDYKVNYKDAIWATILENRLKTAKSFLKDTGSIFVRCDYNGNWIIRPILDNYFQYTNEIIISKSAKLTEQINKYHSGHDTLYFYTKTEKYDFETVKRKRNEPKWRAMHLPGTRYSLIPERFIKLFSKNNVVEKKENFYTKARIILGRELLPPNGRHWALSQETIVSLEKENKIKLNDKDEPQTQESEWQRLTDNWTDYVGCSSTWGFITENHEKIIERAITTSSLQKQEIIFDFF
ncbi:hypothetical protein ATZ36_04810 [Candidatus Endomicrobiellum trichonymphae]|uniref:site-specific DNA-methyltransferase (adenine-specific) n=1 Tax=Endomicrobium trichonymphae TaxID=1408204 RepID=A0A1E5IIT4_ENDTX|nr:hypothetical protein ATZ36_04810 [Candidatus Endomicrobium trichonymphae]